jgi:hypothetical protein
LQGTDQSVHIAMEIGIRSDSYALSKGHERQTWRQLSLRRHGCIAHKYRNHPNTSRQCGFDLDANDIVGVVQASLAGVVSGVEPSRSDNGQKELALTNDISEVSSEINAERNRINVFEDVVRPELRRQAVVNAPRRILIVAASIRDKNPTHCSLWDEGILDRSPA